MAKKLVKITDPQVLASTKLKELLEPIKAKLSEEEKSVLNALENPEDRRAKVIEYYTKYIDAVIAEAETEGKTFGQLQEQQKTDKPVIIEKITDPQVLATKSTEELLSIVSTKITPEEGTALQQLTSDEEKRTKVIEYYTKYIDAVIAEQPKADNTAPVVENQTQQPQTHDKDYKQPGMVITNESTLVTDAPVGANLTNTYAVEIRKVPGYNGYVTLGADKLIAMVIKNPNGFFKFKSALRANTFIKAIEGVRTVKDLYNITPEKKKAAINTVKKSNGIK